MILAVLAIIAIFIVINWIGAALLSRHLIEPRVRNLVFARMIALFITSMALTVAWAVFAGPADPQAGWVEYLSAGAFLFCLCFIPAAIVSLPSILSRQRQNRSKLADDAEIFR